MPVDVIIDPSSGQIYWNDNAGSGSTQSIAISGNANDSINFVGYSNFFTAGGAGQGTRILATFNDAITSTFVPGTNAYDLGSTSLRWNLYATGGNFSGVISTSSATASTSTSTGALTVTGGVGIGGSIWTSTTNFSSISGVGFQNSSITSGVWSGTAISAVNGGTGQVSYTIGDILYASSTTALSKLAAGTAGSVLVSGGAGAAPSWALASSSGGTVSTGTQYQIAGYYSAVGSSVTGSTTFTNNTATGIVTIGHTTSSTASTNGALLVYGGLGVSGNIYSNGTLASTYTAGTALNIANRVTVYTSSGFENLNVNSNYSFAFNVQDTANNNRFTVDVQNNRTNFSGSSAAHEIRFYHSNQSSYTGFKANSSGTVTYTWPAGDGTANQVLYTNGSAALGWTTPSGSAAGSSTQLQYNNAGAFGATSSLTYVPSTQILSTPNLTLTNAQANEGGEIVFSIPSSGTALTTTITVDIYQNKLRFFETGGANRGAYIDFTSCTSSVGTNLLVGSGASGLTSLNGLTASTQTFATGTSGTDFNISSSTSTHTFNIPYAGSGATGLVTTQAQTIAGTKTFSSQTIVSDATTSTTTGTGALLVYGGLGVSGQINSTSLVTSGNVVINGNLQFKGNGTFGDATSDTITSLARYASDLLPSADNSYDLGNNSLGWRNFKVSGVGTIGTLNVTATTGSGSTTTGALTVVGGVGIGGTINAGTRNLSYTASGLLAGFAGSVNSYVQIVLQNTSPTSAASSDFIVNNDLSTDSTYYGSMGMNSSGFTGSGSLNLANAVYFTSTTGDLVLGSTTANILRFVYNSGTTDSMQITGTAVTVLYTTGATSTTTGALIVGGGVGIGGSLWTSSTNFSSISGVGHSSGAITSGVWSGTAISVTNGGTGQASLTANSVLLGNGTAAIATTTGSSAQVLVWQASGAPAFVSLSGDVTITAAGVATIAANSVALGTDTTGQYASTIAISGTGITATSAGADDGTAYTIYSSATSANTASAIVQRDGSGNFTAGTITASLTGTASIASSSVLSATTTDTSSTLYLLGSRSSTGFAGTAIYVDTNISIAGSQITAGVWAGTAISAVNGGTGQVSYTIGDLLYASSTTALSKLAAGTAGSVLTSNGAGTAPSWKAATGSTGGGSPAGSTSQLQYNNGGSFGATSSLTFNKNGNNEFIVSAPYLVGTQGVINIGPEAFDGVTLGQFSGSSNGTQIAVNTATGFIGNFADFQIRGASKFTIGYDGKITVVGVYSLPTTAGTAGSVLTSNGTGGQFYWTAPGAAGGGSGTVTSGTAGSVAYYTGTGTTVGGAPGFTYTTSGTASTINVFGGGAIGTTIFTVQALSATSVRVGIGTNLPQYELEIVGEISATNKSFVIDHPTKPGKKLRYGSLEGPENGVYVRGELKGSNIIETPDHWEGLVSPDSFTVTLTPIGRFAHLYVEKIEDYKVYIADDHMNPIHCYYTVWAERKDIPKLITEY